MTDATQTPQQKPLWKRLLPVAVLAVLAIAFFQSGLAEYISVDAVAVHFATLTGFVDQNPLLAYLAAALLYMLAVAVAFPAAWLITVFYGLIFGLIPAVFIVVIGATMGACALYFVAGNLLADFFRQKAGDRLNQMAKGFRENEVSYMLFLRLTPIFPFLLVNALPAILGISFVTFVWTTAIGIIPGTLAYVSAGEGLRSVIAERADACAAQMPPCGTPLNASDFLTREILVASVLLALVSLIPIGVKWWRNRGKADKANSSSN